MPPGPPIYLQTIREGPGYITNVSGTRTDPDPQYDPGLMADQGPHLLRTFPLPIFAPPVGQRLSSYLTLTYNLASQVWYLWDRLQYRCLI